MSRPSSPIGLHRVLAPAGVLPQAADRLDATPDIWPDEVRISVERLNLDAASYRQLTEAHAGDGEAVRAAVLEIVRSRGKMHNPVTGSGGMLVGTVEEVGPDSPLGLAAGDRGAPLGEPAWNRVAKPAWRALAEGGTTDVLAGWSGITNQGPAAGHAILFGRS